LATSAATLGLRWLADGEETAGDGELPLSAVAVNPEDALVPELAIIELT